MGRYSLGWRTHPRGLRVGQKTVHAQVVRTDPQRIYSVLGRPVLIQSLDTHVRHKARQLVIDDRGERPVDVTEVPRDDLVATRGSAYGVVEVRGAGVPLDELAPREAPRGAGADLRWEDAGRRTAAVVLDVVI